MLIIVLLISIW